MSKIIRKSKAEPRASPQEWKALYAAAARVKALAPWEWMEESDIFAIENPDTGEIGFVSVMGMAGEHFAIAVYRGSEALDSFWMIEDQTHPTLETARAVLLMSQMQASWEDRDTLDKRDRDQIKSLGLKFRGRNAWPMFRVTTPGYMGWPPQGADVRYLTMALEQAADVAARLREDEAILIPPDEFNELPPERFNELYLFRCRTAGGAWQDVWRERQPGKPPTYGFTIEEDSLEALQALPLARGKSWEIALEMMLTPVGDRRDRPPYFPFMLLAADPVSRMILGFELLHPDPTLADVYSAVPQAVIDLLLKNRVRPQRLVVSHPIAVAVLRYVMGQADITVEEGETMAAQEFMDTFAPMSAGLESSFPALR